MYRIYSCLLYTSIESQLEQYVNADGMQYGIPFRLDCKLFFYNKAIFDEHNLTVPTTWDEFINVCETLKAAGITPISFGNQEPWSASHYIGTLNQICVPDEVKMCIRDRVFVGYSDITNLLNAFSEKCGFVTYHGPMVSSNILEHYDDYTRAVSYTHLIRMHHIVI